MVTKSGETVVKHADDIAKTSTRIVDKVSGLADDAAVSTGSKFANLSSAERQALITKKTQEQALRRVEAQRVANGGSIYGHIPDPKSVGAGKEFTAAQRANIYDANRKVHGGVLRSDLDGSVL